MPEPATAPTATEEERAAIPTPFAALLQQHRGAGLHNELGEQIAAISAAVVEFQKKGTLTLTLTVEPSEEDLNAVVIHDDWKSKIPRATPKPSKFFANEHGTLSRRDPRQPEIEGLRDASK